MTGSDVSTGSAGTGRFRRARSLVGYWENGEFILENYLSHRRAAVPSLVMYLLGDDEGYATVADLVSRLRIPGAGELVARLIEQDVFVREGSLLDVRDSTVATRWPWGRAASFFHFSAQNVRFHEDLQEEAAQLKSLADVSRPPSVYKEYSGEAVDLASDPGSDRDAFWDVLRERRTRRSCSGEAVSLEDVARVLAWTWGRSQVRHDPVFGEYILKTSPSGGSRHPIEVYPLVLRVDGLTAGLYHYSVQHNRLVLLREGGFSDLAVRLCAGQEWVKDAAVVCFMTAVLERSAWKYHQPHAYRVIHLDAGHLGQTFHLVCTHLGLAPFTTAASRDDEIEAFLGIDGVSELPMYVAVFGIPTREAADLPAGR